MSARAGSPASSSPRAAARSKARRPRGEVTRERVLDAAVRCILDVGYYQASSNAIAREAGRYGITSNAISLSSLEPQLEEPAKSN